MKKSTILFSLVTLGAMLLCIPQASAQKGIDPKSLVGTWVGEITNQKDGDDTVQMQDTEIYNSDNSYESISNLSYTRKMDYSDLDAVVTLKCTFKSYGKWTLKGDKIKYKYDKRRSTATIDDVIIDAEGKRITEPSIVNYVKDELKKDVTTDVIAYPKSVKIVSLEGDRMVQDDGDEKSTYTRK